MAFEFELATAALELQEDGVSWRAKKQMLLASKNGLKNNDERNYFEVTLLDTSCLTVGYLLNKRPYNLPAERKLLATGAAVWRGEELKKGQTVGIFVDNEGLHVVNDHQRCHFDAKSRLALKRIKMVYAVLSLAENCIFKINVDKSKFLYHPEEFNPSFAAGDGANWLEDRVPNDVLDQIFARSSLEEFLTLRIVSKSFKKMVEEQQNEAWKTFFMRRWPLQNSNMRIKSWWTLFLRRCETVFNRPEEKLMIENCGWAFKCPLVFSQLTGHTDSANRKFCSQCQESVFLARTKAELEEHTKKGHCVSYEERRGGRKLMGRKCF
jgi:hypothetical protein